MVRKTLRGRSVYQLSLAECKDLFKTEAEAVKNTFPVSSDGYANALMTKSGSIYTGVSYISDTDTLTMHSEATALAHAAIHGEKEVVAITGPNCHICKQLIYENSLRSGIDIMIVMKKKGKIVQMPISKFMLYPWPEKPKSLDKIKKEKMNRLKF